MLNPYYCWILLFYIPNKHGGYNPIVPPCFTLSSAGLRRCLAVPSMCHALRVPGDNAPKRKSWRIGPSSAGAWRDPQGESRMYFFCEMCKELSYMGLFENGWTWDISFKCPFYCFLMRIMVTIQWNWDGGLNKRESITSGYKCDSTPTSVGMWSRAQLWICRGGDRTGGLEDKKPMGSEKPTTICRTQCWWVWSSNHQTYQLKLLGIMICLLPSTVAATTSRFPVRCRPEKRQWPG